MFSKNYHKGPKLSVTSMRVMDVRQGQDSGKQNGEDTGCGTVQAWALFRDWNGKKGKKSYDTNP